MRKCVSALCCAAAFGVMAWATVAPAQKQAAPAYHIYTGNTHSHTQYTWSHGEQWTKSDCAGILVYAAKPDQPFVSLWDDGYVKSKTCPGIYVIDGLQYPAPGMRLRENWQEVQGPPSKDYEVARAKGMDFEVTTDHSQEAVFWPEGGKSAAWQTTLKQANAATDAQFVAIPGFEFSENDGPGGTGHINVINSAEMLNALAPGVDLPKFYKWVSAAKPAGPGPVVAVFNHPGEKQYDDWAGYSLAANRVLTMLEIINSNKNIHYQGFVRALDKGWKLSPVSGLDNHGLTGLEKGSSRTFVLATSRTRAAILEAMQQRRTYASLDSNIQCRYTANGRIMGSVLAPAKSYRFAIHISDPDTQKPADKITKIDIVTDHGEVVQTYTPDTPAYTADWSPVIEDAHSHYFFVRVWNAGGGDAPGADASKPVAWLAPVWTGR